MTGRTTCIERLRGLIERSDRGELAEAQAAIIEYALGSSDLASRSTAMAALQNDLAEDMAARDLQPNQAAYYAVIEAMIDRTRDAVLDVKPKPAGA